MVELGHIIAPSGVLVVTDLALLGSQSGNDPVETHGEHERMGVATYEADGSGVVVLNVPPDRELPVSAVPSEEDERRWSHLLVYIAEGEPAEDAEEVIGRVGAPSGHLAFLDEDLLPVWDHEAVWERDEPGVRANGHARIAYGDARAIACRTTVGDDGDGFEVRSVRSAGDELLAVVIRLV